MYDVARGLKRELLAPTSGLWTLRSTGLPATEALHRAGAGQDPVSRGVGLATQLVQNSNEGVQLVVVGSSAGGTGSGFAIPFALQARRGFGPAPIEIVSLLAGASAFENTWDARDLSTRSRGTSGTFAVFREIDFLSAKPEEFATPGWREIPVAGGLRYFVDNGVALSPNAAVAGYQLARTAYWLGRRTTLDTVANAYNCLQELARFYAAMSDAGLATMLNGKPVMQSSPLALTPGLVSVEYRRLEVAERVAGDLLIHTIDNEIIGSGTAVAPANASYFVQPPQQDEADITAPYAAFARDIKAQVFTNAGDVTAGRITPKQLQTFVTSLAPEITMTSETPPTDTERRLPATDWADTRTQLITRMNHRLEELDRKQREEIDAEAAAELIRVDTWLRRDVVTRELNRPGKVHDVIAGLTNIRLELANIRRFYLERQWDAGLVRDNLPIPTRTQAEADLAEARQNMEPVSAAQGTPRRGGWDAIVRIAGCLFIGILAGGGAWLFTNTWLATAVAGIIGFAAAYYITRPQPKQGPNIARLRLEAFDRLRQAYEQVLLARRAASTRSS